MRLILNTLRPFLSLGDVCSASPHSYGEKTFQKLLLSLPPHQLLHPSSYEIIVSFFSYFPNFCLLPFIFVQVVRMLVNAHPNLMTGHTRLHTPLHLAARNGHYSTIQTLLDAAMEVNCVVSGKTLQGGCVL